MAGARLHFSIAGDVFSLMLLEGPGSFDDYFHFQITFFQIFSRLRRFRLRIADAIDALRADAVAADYYAADGLAASFTPRALLLRHFD